MNKHRPMQKSPAAPQNSSSVISYGTSVVGRCKTRGSVKIEGRMEGSMEAEKGISIGKDGVVIGDITTRDAVIDGRIQGKMTIASLVRLQASCDVNGEIETRTHPDRRGRNGQRDREDEQRAQPALRFVSLKRPGPRSPSPGPRARNSSAEEDFDARGPEHGGVRDCLGHDSRRKVAQDALNPACLRVAQDRHRTTALLVQRDRSTGPR